VHYPKQRSGAAACCVLRTKRLDPSACCGAFSGWTNMRVTARVSATNMPSSNKGKVQLILRDGAGPDFSCSHNDPLEGYAFSLDFANNEAQLNRREGCDSKATLDDVSKSLSVGTTYEIVAIADGSSLSFYMDGVLVLEVEDNEWSSGSIGFYCFRIDCSLDYISVEVSEVISDIFVGRALATTAQPPSSRRTDLLDGGMPRKQNKITRAIPRFPSSRWCWASSLVTTARALTRLSPSIHACFVVIHVLR